LRQKLKRFEENRQRQNVIEQGKDLYMHLKGKWNEHYFKNRNPIHLELACGRGEYTVGLAALFPDINFIGVDVKGDRIWKGSTLALEKGLQNVAFLRANVLTLLNFFDSGEAEEIWIIHPDPRPRKRDVKRRLTSERFIDLYKQVLSADGWIKFKTDNLPLFEFTLEELSHRSDILGLSFTYDLYNSELREDHYGIETKYEKKFTGMGHQINYLKFQFNRNVSDRI
jgi:tRNA (guanine-N7-)-methyltransferase